MSRGRNGAAGGAKGARSGPRCSGWREGPRSIDRRNANHLSTESQPMTKACGILQLRTQRPSQFHP